jgi:phosphotransferase system HPr-like phosphotransfer protein
MQKVNITLQSVQAVRDFVQQVILLDYEVDLVQGRYIVDAKSIMGIFALDTLSPIEVIAHTDDASEFFKRIDCFIAK